MADGAVGEPVLVAEIGSTTTLINALAGLDGDAPRLIGQAQALTTVEQGDVLLGLREALSELKKQIGPTRDLEILATSSAAGGLSVTVHGLVYEMTVRAAREAALGAGAVIRLVTAGMLGPEDLARVEAIDPRLIFLAGGVDYGEERTVLENGSRLSGSKCRLGAAPNRRLLLGPISLSWAMSSRLVGNARPEQVDVPGMKSQSRQLRVSVTWFIGLY